MKKGIVYNALALSGLLNQEIFENFKDGIRGILTPINNNNLTYINTSRKLEVNWSQIKMVSLRSHK